MPKSKYYSTLDQIGFGKSLSSRVVMVSSHRQKHAADATEACLVAK